MNELRALLVGVLGVALLLLVLAAALIFFGQRSLLFPGGARRATADGPERAGGERLPVSGPGASGEAWLLPARAGRAAGPLLLFAHGNGELIDDWLDAFEPLRARGASVLLVEYPGYGRARGSPSERSIAAAFVSAYDFALRERGFAGRPVVGWGRSLGGGAVCALARERPLAALLLESTFAGVVSMAREMGLPERLARWLVRDPFDNLTALRRFRGPLLLLHGEHDEVIPPSQARVLHEQTPGSELHWLPCGHNDCPRPWPLVLPFLERHGLLGGDV